MVVEAEGAADEAEVKNKGENQQKLGDEATEHQAKWQQKRYIVLPQSFRFEGRTTR